MHAHIENFQPVKAIEELKISNMDVNATNEEGLTPLQLAAREGMTEVVKRLLLAEAKVDRVESDFKHEHPWITLQASQTSLFLALQYGHDLIARILLAAGASKELASSSIVSFEKFNDQHKVISPELSIKLTYLSPKFAHLFGLMAWIIQNDNNEQPSQFFDAVLQLLVKNSDINSSHIGGLIELAAQCGKKNITKKIVAVAGKDKIRCDSEFRIAPYWAALKTPEIFDELCPTDAHWAMTLKQLHQDSYAEILISLYAKSTGKRATLDGMDDATPATELLPKSKSRSDDVEFIDFKTQFPLKLPKNEEIKLSPTEVMAYNAVAQASTQIPAVFLKTNEERYHVLKHAYAKANIVALQTLLQIFDVPALLKMAIEDNQVELARFVLASAEQDMYSLAISWRKNGEFIAKFNTDHWSQNGLLHCLIHRGIQKEILPASEAMELFRKLEVKEVTIAGLLQRCIINRYKFASAFAFKPSQEFPLNLDLVFPGNHPQIAGFFERFKVRFMLPRDATDGLEFLLDIVHRDCLSIVISYLDESEQEELSKDKGVSQSIKDIIYRINKNAIWCKRSLLFKLQSDIFALNTFMDCVNASLKAKSSWERRFSHMRKGDIARLIFLSLVAGVDIFCATQVRSGVIGCGEAYGRLEKITHHGKTCLEDPGAYPYLGCYTYTSDPKMPVECKSSCMDLGNNLSITVFASLGIGVTTFSLPYWIKELVHLFKPRADRFDTVPISGISPAAAEAQTALLAYFAKSKPNPLEGFGAHSEFKSIRDKVGSLLEAKQAEEKILKEEVRKLSDNEAIATPAAAELKVDDSGVQSRVEVVVDGFPGTSTLGVFGSQTGSQDGRSVFTQEEQNLLRLS